MTRVSFTPAPSEVAMPRTRRVTPRVVAVSALAFIEDAPSFNSKRCSRGERGRHGDRGQCEIHTFLAILGRNRKPFSTQHHYVRDADKAKDELEIRLDILAWRARWIDTTAR